MRKRFYTSEPNEGQYYEDDFGKKKGKLHIHYEYKYNIFCYCPYCGVESYGCEYDEDFESGRCPVCGEPILKNDGYYFEIKERWKGKKGFNFYNAETLEFTKYNERKEFENIPDEEKEKLHYLSLEAMTEEIVSDPSSIEEIAVELDVVFHYMSQLREESHKQKAQDKVSGLIEQYSVSGSDGLTISSPDTIKNDTETLKIYIQNLIRVETNLYSAQTRLCSLYLMSERIKEKLQGDRYQITAGSARRSQ